MASPLARALRAQSTDAERLLWSKLRDRGLGGFKFRRQVPLGPYVVDFCCLRARLAVEVDGGQHALGGRRDEQRTAWLQTQGFHVMRFWNNDVLANLDGVLETILIALQEEASRAGPGAEGAGAIRPPADVPAHRDGGRA